MNNIHPLFKQAIAPVVAKPAPTLRPFSVCIQFNGQSHNLNVVAFTGCDAVIRAIDIYFDGDDTMPEGLKIDAAPMNFLPAAA